MFIKSGRSVAKSLKCQIDFFKSENKTLRHALLVEKQKRKQAEDLNDAMMIDYEKLNQHMQSMKAAYEHQMPKVMQRRLKKGK
ncbi:MAG TPA: hypothetical protein H9948_10625 [Candidatus Jeotgalibaca merdavium]|uniref:Uncharacterized protein n=1 Tax=Candidatus Jeotgalibaca merdavium TaxID=2838627 RepID=A0A9D2KZ95_9LACT|nr:hypothetical protein [Candidatus Jeotgalibaca merdavium]